MYYINHIFSIEDMEIKLLTYKNINELITGRPLDDITVGRVTCYLWGGFRGREGERRWLFYAAGCI